MTESVLGGVLLFPVWWYTRGLALVSRWALGSVQSAAQYLSLGVWVKNLFVPMYGDESFAGRAISFGIRFFMIIVRGIGVLLWGVVVALLWMFYLLSLPLSVFGLLFHGGGLLVT